MQLGEDDKSWGYTSATGKMVTNKVFEEYGEKFEKGDIIGAFLDIEGDEVLFFPQFLAGNQLYEL